MATASLNLTVIEKRMLTPVEGAAYSGIPLTFFKLECPVAPVELRPSTLLYDKQDLDKWIDSKKHNPSIGSHDSIVERL